MSMSEQRDPQRDLAATGPARVLVVGATRILRPAVDALSDRATRVTAVARSAADLRALARGREGRITPLAVDVTTGGFDRALADTAGHAPLTGAVVYAPAVPPGELAARVGPYVAGPVVVLVTSEWAAPGRGGARLGAGVAEQGAAHVGSACWSPDDLPVEARSGAPGRLLVLGWRDDGPARSGSARPGSARPGSAGLGPARPGSAGGGTRWHTPQEISAAALASLDADDDRDALLGAVRPWSMRPA
ncbi:hypothetical protein [Streptomyces sp. NPDC049813]|uniref:hypothetical protein n=1 Tax=Streptomyces sp. NPDC049813 TaxID=3365597 RepID=UPI0037AD4817